MFFRRKERKERGGVFRRVVIREEDLDGLTSHEMLDLVRAIEHGEDFVRRSYDGLYIGDVHDALGNYLGSYEHPRDKITHVVIFGSTGMGKSTLLIMIARHLMLKGEGVSIFDPHGELARDILSLVPRERVGDVIFVDPAFFESVGKVIRINPLEYDPNDPSSRERAAQDFMTPLRKLYAEFWGPRLERILYHAMKLLLSFPPGEVQLIDLYDLIMNDKRREELVHAAKGYGLDPATERFWLFEFGGYKEEAVQAVLTKITQLLSNTYSSMIFNSETGFSDVDLRDVLNRRKILVVSTPIGILREVPAQFISSFIITRYFLAAMERINVGGENAMEYPDHWVIIDEAHIAESQALIDIVTQARKYKLHVILATQYPGQFSEDVKSSILNNASIIITFKNGPDAADELARIFQVRRNELEEKKLEIMNLPRYAFLAKFQDDPIPKLYYTNNIKESLKNEIMDWRQVAEVSMKNYAKDLLREYAYMPLLSREAILMLGQYLSLSGTFTPPSYSIEEQSFMRYMKLKYKQYKIEAESEDALLELKSQGLLLSHDGEIIPGKMLREYINRIERIHPIAKNTITKFIYNSYIYIPQKAPNLLTPDIIIDKNGRKKKGKNEENNEKE
ncbi:MAG: type IV secretory system conjugative DNA transfer family protein, partial [Thermoprotei archaeon]